MPTLAARNSPALTTTTAMSTISSSSADVATTLTTTTTATAPPTTTTTTSALANANIVNHHYHHPPAPPAHSVAGAAGVAAAASGSGGGGSSALSTGTALTTTAAMAATATITMSTNVAPSLATFNGNSNLNVANGNIVGGNSNTNTNALNATNNTSNNVGKKPLSTLASSREDVTSLGGTSSINSQLSANNHNNSAGSGNSSSNNNGNGNHLGGGSNQSSSSNGGHGNNCSNNNNNNNNNNGSSNTGIIKGSKENLLQNYYNGIGNDGASGLATHSADNDDPGDGLGPLPPKWETAYTERGELYFIDHNTGTSHWLDPRLSKFQKKSLEDCSDDELPYGWEKIEDSLYGTYYIDHVNRRTQYENPVLEAKRRAAEQKQKQQQQQSHNQLQSQSQPQLQSQQTQQQQQQRPQTPSILLNGSAMAGGAPGSRAGIAAPSLVGNVLDISQRSMQPPPPGVALKSPPAAHLPYKFTRNPAEMQGERITCTLLKSARGLGITIVGGDDGVDEFLQIKSIVPNGPAWLDGQLQTGDVLVYVNDTCVLGFTHHEMVNIFQSILPGENVTLEVCRGYSLPFDPNDPNTEVVTTIAVDGISAATDKQRRMLLNLHMDGNYNFLDVSGESNGKGTGGAHGHLHARNLHSPAMLGGATAAGGGVSGSGLNDGFILMKKSELVQTLAIVKGAMGFGFTIADSAYGQKVKKILDRNCCTQLQEGDILLEINNVNVRQKSHLEVVQLLKDCSKTEPTIVKIQRGILANVSPGGLMGYSSGSGDAATAAAANSAGNGNCLGNVAKLRKNFVGSTVLFRSKTPTADLYSTQQKEILPIRPKTPLVDTRRARVQTPNNELQQQDDEVAAATATGAANGDCGTLRASKSQLDGHHKSSSSLQEMDALHPDIPYMDPYPKLVTSLSERLAESTLLSDVATSGAGGLNAYQHGSGISMNNAPNTLGMRGAATHYDQQEYVTAGAHGFGVGGNYNPIYGMSPLPPSMNSLYTHAPPSSSQHLPHYGANSVAANSGAAGYSPSTPLSLMTPPSPHSMLHPHQQHAALAHAQYSPGTLHGATPLQAAHIQNERMQRRVNELLNDRRRVGFSALDAHQQHQSAAQQQQQQQQHSHMLGGIGYQQLPPPQQPTHLQHSPAVSSISQQPPNNAHWLGGSGCYNTLQPAIAANLSYAQRNGLDAGDADGEQYELNEVTLERQALGFGFRIVGGTEEGSQVTVGHVVPGGAADNDQRINTGDEILSIDGINVVNSSHHKVVSLMGEAALRGQVNMILRRRVRPAHSQQPPPTLGMPIRTTLRYPYDVIVTRHEAEGFGFVIISSSNQYYGSTIGKLIPSSPADRCGELKVGDRIVAVNRIDIAGMSHGDVVNLIKESGLHVRLTIGAPKEQGNVGASGNNSLLINSAQGSPGQLSQTQQLMQTSLAQQSPVAMTTLLTPTQQHQQQQQQNHQQQKQLLSPLLQADANGAYFERPSTSASAAVVMTQQQHQQQQQQHQPQL